MKRIISLVFYFLCLTLPAWSNSGENVPLHERTSAMDESNSFINDKGEKEFKTPENLTTWIFEDGTFIPMAKLQGDKSYSIITDHLGTPTEAYDEEEADAKHQDIVPASIYGETRKETGFENFILFLYQGQYEDSETGLAYNRYRYYDPNSGIYVSQDPIRLEGNNPNFYAYVKDVGNWVDPFGLDVASGSGRTHVKYSGVKNGQPYHGYASAPTADGLTSDQIVARRYGNNFDDFDVNPSVDYTGEGVEGKNTARGLEQRGFEADGGL